MRTIMVVTLLVAPMVARAFVVDEARVVDLSHAFDAETIYWPTYRAFELEVVSRGHTDGHWYAANEFCAAEHGGTHLDAPLHFAERGETAEAIPLRRLMGPAVVVDLREAAAADADALLAVEHLARHEREHGRIPEGAIVLVDTGWASRWPDRLRYLGDDTPGDASRLHFPGVSREAATWLVTERRIDAIGIDTASIDHGPSRDFPTHQVLAAAGVPVLENLASLDRLPPTGAAVIALPMKIAGGTGGPARVIAVLPPAR